MKRIKSTLLLALSVFFTSCATLGVATSGGKYFNGKKEEELVKYFKYEGEAVKADDNFDKILYFTNLVSTMYVDKTTVEKFKNRKYSTVSNLNFYELYDGCLVYPETYHIQDVKWNGKIDKTVTQDVSKSASREPGIQPSSGYGIRTHRNNNTEISALIKSFNSAVQQYGAIKKNADNTLFEKTNIGGFYYIYDIQSNKFSYSDGVGTSATEYKYILQKVSVYEDSKSSTETHTAYIYNDREKSYTDEKGNAITKETALQNEKSYISKGFSSRKKNKGLALTAYIKDGVVVKVETVE